ncbi:MAG: hypothetical protein JKY92_01620 [Magnetovibrio sp.]|nr:hypothetical protein [Magnetovibrio sp.]
MAQLLDVHSDTRADSLASLAEKLVKRLGVKDALRICQENSWYGVFNFIKGHIQNNNP